MTANSLFDSEKALEAVLYVADRVRDHDVYLTLKTIYMADKLHLERYGRMIVWDRYHALERGPVPSRLYDAVKYANGKRSRSPIDGVEDAFAVSANRIRRTREPDLDVFSVSDLECLDEAIRNYGRLSFQEAMDKSHDAAYWKTERNKAMDIRDIARAAGGGDALIEHLEERYIG